jgi:peptidoglycan/LPS O-acetylase OafA/YrhL
VKISPAQSDFLNWSRWVAAWLVVAEHARSLVFVDYGDLQSPGLLAKGFYFLTGFGHEAVMVFFVISGYLVGGKVWSLYREGRFGWRRYLADRASRLYAVLLVALLLGAALDWSGYLFFNQYGLYNQGYEGSIAVLGTAPVEKMGWRDFLGNALFLQTIAGPTFGSNGPLWSLAYEWWYYILFPSMVVLVFRRSLMGVVVGALLTLLLLFVLPADAIWLFGIWVLGVAAAIVKPRTDSGERRTEGKGENRKVESGNVQRLQGEKLNEEMGKAKFGRMFFWGGAALLFLGILVLARVEVLKGPYVWQYLLGVAYALLLVSLAGCQWRLPVFRSSAYLADFSYSVYLIHFPVLMFVLSVGFESFGFGIRGPFSLAGLVWYIGVIGIAIFVSWIVSRFTEARTASLRVIFYKLLWVETR